MKKILLSTLIIGGMALSSYASASAFTSQTIGNTTFHSGSGLSGTSTRIGSTTFHSGSINGNSYSGTSQSIGGTTFSYWD